MANSVQAKEITIEGLQEAIEEALRKAFPKANVCGYEALTQRKGAGRKKLSLPALVLSLGSFEYDVPTATEQLAVTLRWELRVVCSKKGGKAETEVRRFAALTASFINGNRFGFKVKGAQFVAAGEDQFSPELVDLEPWLVEFEQSVCLGSSCFDDDFLTPDEVYVSMAPEIGLENIEKYERVTEDVIDELPAS